MNTRVSRIAKRQARLGGFVESPSPPPEASEDDDDDDEDGSSAITRILCHFFVRFPLFDHFHIMGAIDAATIKRSKA